MSAWVAAGRVDLLVALVTGHLLGDFVLQSEWLVERKARFGVATLHAGIVAIVTWIVTGYASSGWWLVPYVLVTHLAIDLAKGVAGRRMDATRRPALFALDQLGHVAALVAVVPLASAVPATAATISGSGVWVALFGSGYPRLLVLVSGWVVATTAAGHFFGFFLARFEGELTPEQKGGLPRGGFWIGVTERSLIYLFILVGEPAGIGFLAAAKSVFRIGEIRKSEDRKLAEYILIGTLLSFTAAMVVGLVTRAVLAALPGQ